MTAPVGEVMTPITLGMKGRRPLAPRLEQAFGRSRRLRSSSSAISAPAPAGSRLSMTIW